MRWFGPCYGLNITSKNGRDDIKLIQSQDSKHMLQSKKMFGRGSGKMQKRVLINMYLLISKIQFEYSSTIKVPAYVI